MIRLFHVFVADEAASAVGAVLMPQADGSIYIGEGPKVLAFESALQDLLDLPRPPLAVNSCTSALDLSLHLIGVGPGDEVVTTPMTCTATNGVIVNRGARIVWADIDRETGLIDPDDVARKITPRTRAIMAVDWGGRVCDYPALRRHGIPVVEDAAHALLATRNSLGVGETGGDYVCWSFQAIKHLTTGDGGGLLTPVDQQERARLLRWYGLDRRSSVSFRCGQNIQEAGFKYHMNDIAASIGLANIPHMRNIVDQHRANADYFHRHLADLPGVVLPPPDTECSWWLYTLLVEHSAAFISFMEAQGIAASPVHARNDGHRAFHFPNGSLPGVDHFARREVAIPVGWWLSQSDRERVVAAVREWSRRNH